MSTIDIYTTPQCGFCIQLKSQLDNKGMKYEAHDVTSSQLLLAEMQALTGGALSVPVVVLDKGEETQQVAIGFEEGKKLVGLESKTSAEAKVEIGHLTCPECQHSQEAEIPTTACIPFYDCDGCKKTIQASGNDCCVFCSYGDKLCPISNKKDGGGCSDGSCSIA